MGIRLIVLVGHPERHPLRDRQALRRGCDAFRRIAPAAHKRADTIADAPSFDIHADRFDSAGDFEARKIARAWRRWIVALALQDVVTIDPGGRHTDQDIVRAM